MNHAAIVFDPRAIIATVARLEQVDRRTLIGKRRWQSLMPARICAALALRIAGFSLLECARFLGGRSHTTIHSLLDSAAAVWPEAAALLGRVPDEARAKLAKRREYQKIYTQTHEAKKRRAA